VSALAETLPAVAYTDPDRWPRERSAIFGASWLCVGHVAEIAEPGDAVEHETAGWPLLLVRKRDGAVQVLANVCRHRAAPLLWDGDRPRGLTHLQCRYHGWRYRLDGTRVASPRFGADLPDGLDLFALPTETWRGLVFAWPGPAAPVDFAAWIHGLDCAAGPLDLTGLVFHKRVRHEIACDWKVYVENYLEWYHIPWLHPGLSADVDLAHYEVIPGERHVVHRVPTRGLGPNAGFWAWLWPSLAVNVYGDGVSVERIVPRGPGRTRIDYAFLFREQAEVDRAVALSMSREVTGEDIVICEAVQRGLASGTFDRGRLSPRHEGGVKRFQDLVRSALN
jgi:choline monooxygenase